METVEKNQVGICTNCGTQFVYNKYSNSWLGITVEFRNKVFPSCNFCSYACLSAFVHYPEYIDPEPPKPRYEQLCLLTPLP